MIERMPYRTYKRRFADCDIIGGSYDTLTKTIEVDIPDEIKKEREKPSGVRGQHFSGYELYFINCNGDIKYCTYRAVSAENAMKQHIKCCKQEGWTPCEAPEGKIAKIFK